MVREIFCPFCSNRLIRKDDNLYCEKGDCGFSKVVQEMMEDALVNVDASKLVDPMVEGFNYYCPNCRSKLKFVKESKSFLCSNCAFKVRSGFAHMLREYHYHKNDLKRYWFNVQRGLGFGVTAFSEIEAQKLASEAANKVGLNFDVVSIIEDVDVRDLDQNHVIPNIGAPNIYGVWFPKLNI